MEVLHPRSESDSEKKPLSQTLWSEGSVGSRLRGSLQVRSSLCHVHAFAPHASGAVMCAYILHDVSGFKKLSPQRSDLQLMAPMRFINLVFLSVDLLETAFISWCCCSAIFIVLRLSLLLFLPHSLPSSAPLAAASTLPLPPHLQPSSSLNSPTIFSSPSKFPPLSLPSSLIAPSYCRLSPRLSTSLFRAAESVSGGGSRSLLQLGIKSLRSFLGVAVWGFQHLLALKGSSSRPPSSLRMKIFLLHSRECAPPAALLQEKL
ncbi:hypothetical protein FQA47_017578 [Oryzias melastigma]|uniref:Uncharacterized protein n=1 Tax=Oryzias melastigma TaxID=30732 RepID=A0A834FFP1_ORYME|nr:hypothetical protein FQA47_017578 [Oryzias melastigma]